MVRRVEGSSPSEGLQNPRTSGFPVHDDLLASNVRWIWSPRWSLQSGDGATSRLFCPPTPRVERLRPPGRRGAGLRRPPVTCVRVTAQKPQLGFGAGRFVRKAPPTGAVITLMS